MIMKDNYTPIERELNIINVATEDCGFEVNKANTFENIVAAAIEAIEDFDVVDYDSPVDDFNDLGYDGKYLAWSDGKGYNWWAQGEFGWEREYANANAGDRVDLEKVIDSEGKLVQLYIIK